MRKKKKSRSTPKRKKRAVKKRSIPKKKKRVVKRKIPKKKKVSVPIGLRRERILRQKLFNKRKRLKKAKSKTSRIKKHFKFSRRVGTAEDGGSIVRNVERWEKHFDPPKLLDPQFDESSFQEFIYFITSELESRSTNKTEVYGCNLIIQSFQVNDDGETTDEKFYTFSQLARVLDFPILFEKNLREQLLLYKTDNFVNKAMFYLERVTKRKLYGRKKNKVLSSKKTKKKKIKNSRIRHRSK